MFEPNNPTQMHTRLTATYSVFDKIILSVFVFLFSLVGLSKIRFPSWIGGGTPVLTILLFAISYLLIQLIIKKRRVIEFDADNFYIVDLSSKTEQKIPLENVSWLNMRPGKIEVNRWFVPYSLHYQDNNKKEQKISIYVDWLGKPIKEFVQFVIIKNPDFEFKNCTWTFDFKD
jgi:hypothetical protein